MADEALDPTQWPKWKYHPTLPPTMVATPAEEADLDDGYRDRPFSDDERAALADEAYKAASRTLDKIDDDMTRPVSARRRR